ncbi:MAG: 4Fe-4S cluster-binding domain-containing protein [Planctomycetes bacterium]|nr:4Fe-4S cluster-binding domain-containing protein [Planctomycetota bacterium]
MKQVTAIIQPVRLGPVREALSQVGVTGMTLSDVRGFGSQGGSVDTYRGVEYKVEYVPKIQMDIVVSDSFLDPTIDAIIERTRTFACRHVVLTGGEPMIASEVGELTRRLKREDYHVTIETAGTVWQEVSCDLASISPKLSNSTPVDREDGRWADRHEAARINVDVIRRLMSLGDYQLKFVIDKATDLAEVDELLLQVGTCDPNNVLLMPQGITAKELTAKKQWLVELCKNRGFRYCPRLHIELFGATRGT